MPAIEFISSDSSPGISSKPSDWAVVDERGRLVLPPEAAARLGLVPGARVRLDGDKNSLRLHRPVTHLAKIYIEPTDNCNLDCVTCFRNAWAEPIGLMAQSTFEVIFEGLQALDPMPTVYFGGIGEPLFHRRTPEWIARIKALGARVEMITNGTLLGEKKTRELIQAGLDMLWVSIDGATPESYADVRLGAELPNVIENLRRFRRMRSVMSGSVSWNHPKPELGIAFVAMKRNIADLPALLKLGRSLGAMHFSVSNVLPVSEELQEERLYTRALRSLAFMPSSQIPRLTLPKIDLNESTRDALFGAFNSGYNVVFAGSNWGGSNDVCDYIENGSMTVAWNGDVSPCWPLLHTHQSYLHGKPRVSTGHVIGNVQARGLLDLWLDPEYVAYRERVHSFVFPPCTFCGGCHLSPGNQEDCIGNVFPVCGACLWAQGIVQCP